MARMSCGSAKARMREVLISWDVVSAVGADGRLDLPAGWDNVEGEDENGVSLRIAQAEERVRMYRIGAARRNSGIFPAVQYRRNPTFQYLSCTYK